MVGESVTDVSVRTEGKIHVFYEDKSMSEKQFVIGVDAGTSNIKAVLFDLQGNELASHGIAMKLDAPLPNTAEQDMQEIWDNVCTCIAEISRDLNPDQCAGIGITSHGDGTWMIDAQGSPVRKGIFWCDGRAADVVDRWHQSGIARKAFALCGTAVNTGTQACQLAWLKEHEPESLERAGCIFHCKDWIFYKLTGRRTTDETDESLPMLNMSSRQYDDRLFDLFELGKLRDKFPDVLPASRNIGTLHEEAAGRLGLPTGMTVGSGPMDVSACALGVGAIRHGDGSTILGTAGIHQVTMDSADLTPEMVGMTLCHAPSDKWLRLMAVNSATPNVDWFLRELGAGIRQQAESGGASVFDEVDRAIQSVPIGSRGVMYHPYLLPNGERAPFIKPAAKAAFSGLSDTNVAADLLRAVYEGVAFAMVDCYRHMPIEVKAITLSGGGSKSSVWCQIVADAMGTPIQITAGTEFGAKGAAMNVAVATGVFESYEQAVSEMVTADKTYHPDPKHHAHYQKLYPLYKKIADCSAEGWDLRAELQDELAQ